MFIAFVVLWLLGIVVSTCIWNHIISRIVPLDMSDLLCVSNREEHEIDIHRSVYDFMNNLRFIPPNVLLSKIFMSSLILWPFFLYQGAGILNDLHARYYIEEEEGVRKLMAYEYEGEPDMVPNYG